MRVCEEHANVWCKTVSEFSDVNVAMLPRHLKVQPTRRQDVLGGLLTFQAYWFFLLSTAR